MLAVRAWVLRFGRDELGPWERAVWLTGGLLHGRPPLPPQLRFRVVVRQHDLVAIQLRTAAAGQAPRQTIHGLVCAYLGA